MFGLKNKVILVVGGRGYLGRDFCYYFKKQNGIVISADKMASANDIIGVMDTVRVAGIYNVSLTGDEKRN